MSLANGVMAGLITAVGIWVWDTFRLPKFQLIHVAPGRAFLKNNRPWHNYAIGGSFVFCRGPVLHAPNPAALPYGFVIPRMGQRLISVSDTTPGEIVTFWYTRAPRRARGKLLNSAEWIHDPMNSDQSDESQKWKEAHVVYGER